MRTLPIRVWLGLALLSTLLTHLVVSGVLHLFGPTGWPGQQQREHVMALIVDVDASWADPTWQERTRGWLAAAKLDVILWDRQGREIFRTADPALGAVRLTPEGDLVVRHPDPSVQGWMRPTRESGTIAYFWGPPSAGEWGDLGVWLPPVGFLTALIAAILVAVWLVGRAVLRPLSAMSHAARRIADGELEFNLPASRVSEVAEVANAFTAMGDALRQAMYRQADAEQERRLFVSAVAHDLRTPLFALRGYLEALRKGMADSPEKAGHYVAVCQAKADQLERLVADLFSYARLEYLDQVPQREFLEVGELLRQLVEGFHPQAEAKGVDLRIDSASESCLLAADRHLLTRAVSNLLDNALRHTPAGGHVSLEWRRAHDQVVITVSDTGPGIPVEDLPRIFAPLYRGDTSRSRRTGGAGLGLTIAQRVVEAHGGTIVAANRPSGGAKFLVRLPADVPHHPTPEQPSPEASTVR